jgi:hypothetical protein
VEPGSDSANRMILPLEDENLDGDIGVDFVVAQERP